MALTQAQLPALKAAILAETDPAFVEYRTAGAVGAMADFYNADSAFVVFKTTEQMDNVGKAVNYVAFEALTTANLEKLNTFRTLNEVTIAPVRSDVRSFFANVFSGALGGQGQATRDALDALWRRFAKRGERIYATGTGTTLAPGALVYEGDVSIDNVVQALALP